MSTILARIRVCCPSRTEASPTIHITKQRTVFGRSRKQCDVVVRPGTLGSCVSRQHCSIELVEGDKWFIEDHGSMNGTFINGTRIDGRMQLADRDLISFGGCKNGGRVSGMVEYQFLQGDGDDEVAGHPTADSNLADGASQETITPAQTITREDSLESVPSGSLKRDRECHGASQPHACPSKRRRAADGPSQCFGTRLLGSLCRVINCCVGESSSSSSAPVAQSGEPNGAVRASSEPSNAKTLQDHGKSGSLDQIDKGIRQRSVGEDTEGQCGSVLFPIEMKPCEEIGCSSNRECQGSETTPATSCSTVDGDTSEEQQQAPPAVHREEPPQGVCPKNTIELLKSECTCPICRDVFVSCMTLACGHSFCKGCIEVWLGENPSCPNCRVLVTKPPVKSRALDNTASILLSTDLELKQSWEHRKSDEDKREKEAIAAEQELETCLQHAVNKGLRFLDVENKWNRREKHRFQHGVKRHVGKSRVSYCKSVGLTEDFIAAAPCAVLKQVAMNLELSNVGSQCGQSLNGGLLRDRLLLYIKYC